MEPTLQTVLKEARVFEPSKEFNAAANVSNAETYKKLCEQAEKDPEGYWAEVGAGLTWAKEWDKVLEWKAPFARWFVGGKINASENCLDRHLAKHADKAALIWEAEDGTVETWTYRKLHAEVCALSNVLENDLKLKPGSTAAIYMPLIPQTVIAMLACARSGITHSVIFGGFSSNSVRDRIQDAGCEVAFVADVGNRRGSEVPLLEMFREAVAQCPSVKNVLVHARKTTPLISREVDWAKAVAKAPRTHTPQAFDSEHPLFFLYTSGTTGKPKGIVHTTAGYLASCAISTKWVLDLKPSDIYWCTADVGWVTGHSYLVYGPLANAGTVLMYEGALNFPDAGRIWKLIDKHKVTILYTAPTAIRSFMRAGDEFLKPYKLNSLRLLGSVGEPINPEAWIWYQQKIGKGNCPIVDTWWQTETGAMMIAPLPGVTPLKPGSATRALPGIAADIVDENGKSCAPGQGGYLVIKKPWPSMLRGIHGDQERYVNTYWSRFPGIYFTGDGAHRDEDGFFWIKGRIDDVINVSGHRLGTMEVESALVSHSAVAEAAVVGRPDELKGQGIVAFVTPKDSAQPLDLAKLREELKKHVVSEIGAIARPDEIRFTKTLPKTRSGKIMRRLLKDLAAGRTITGDTTTLENPGLVELMD